MHKRRARGSIAQKVKTDSRFHWLAHHPVNVIHDDHDEWASIEILGWMTFSDCLWAPVSLRFRRSCAEQQMVQHEDQHEDDDCGDKQTLPQRDMNQNYDVQSRQDKIEHKARNYEEE